MPHRRPADEPRRHYGRFLQIGLAASLATFVAAFSVPVGPNTPERFVDARHDAPILVEEIPPTDMTPPAPPPPLPPPPAEVPDDVEVETVVAELELDLRDELPPAAPPLPAPLRQVVPPPIVTPPTVLPDVPAPVLDPPVTDRVFQFVEQQPVLIDGLEGLQRRVEYPRLAREAGIEGRVFVQFVVDERGNVVDPVITRSPSDLLSEAALKAVRESRFQPGSQRGRPVKVRYSLPVTFVLR